MAWLGVSESAIDAISFAFKRLGTVTHSIPIMDRGEEREPFIDCRI